MARKATLRARIRTVRNQARCLLREFAVNLKPFEIESLTKVNDSFTSWLEETAQPPVKKTDA
jgi:hypothetical protein